MTQAESELPVIAITQLPYGGNSLDELCRIANLGHDYRTQIDPIYPVSLGDKVCLMGYRDCADGTCSAQFLPVEVKALGSGNVTFSVIGVAVKMEGILPEMLPNIKSIKRCRE